MKNTIKRLLCAMLCAALVFAAAQTAAAQDDLPKLTVLCANVGGLPIPALFAPEHKIVPLAEKKLGSLA